MKTNRILFISFFIICSILFFVFLFKANIFYAVKVEFDTVNEKGFEYQIFYGEEKNIKFTDKNQ